MELETRESRVVMTRINPLAYIRNLPIFAQLINP